VETGAVLGTAPLHTCGQAKTLAQARPTLMKIVPGIMVVCFATRYSGTVNSTED
jgi:hypothetical protein